jgi:uncharacterized iron-regulated protein
MKERSLPRRPGRFSTWLGALGLAGVVSIVSMALAHPHYDSDEDVVVSRLVNPASEADLSALVDELEQSRVVMIGETHDRYDHHHNQLAVIRGLHERGVPIAVGVEYFQRPFQAHLDDFAAGRIDERALLERTEWRDRWRFDVGLYRDIFAFVQQKGLPMLALNASSETVSAVSAHGIDGLSEETRSLFPNRIELAKGAYRRQLERVFSMHGVHSKSNMERFLQVQYVWDQTMATTAGEYLTANPDRTLVLLVGSGHLLHDNAIPQRLRHINPAAQTVLVTDTGYMPAGAEPDFVFASRDMPVPGKPTQVAGAASAL